MMHVLRRAALEVDENEQRKYTIPGSNYGTPKSLDGGIGTPASIVRNNLGISNRTDRIAGAFENQGPRQGQTNIPDRYPLITKVVGSRQHTSTDGILEYRVEISPVQLVEITKSGILGKRAEPPHTEGSNVPKELTDPNTSLRLWIPASMLLRVHPTLVEQFFDGQGKKKRNGKSRVLPDDFLDKPNDLAEEEDSIIAGSSTRVERLSDQMLDAPMTSRKQRKKKAMKRLVNLMISFPSRLNSITQMYSIHGSTLVFPEVLLLGSAIVFSSLSGIQPMAFLSMNQKMLWKIGRMMTQSPVLRLALSVFVTRS